MKRGFTLLELIVVIAILGLLAALILPLFGRNHEYARNASCANNLSQMGKALIMYSDVPTYATFPTNKLKGRGDPLPSLGILYRDYVSDYRIFSCASKPTIPALAGLGPTIGAAASSKPLTASMTHYGYDSGNKGTDYQPHSPNDAMAIVVADFTAAGRNSDNHGSAAGQNCLRGSGSVEWFDSVVNVVATSDKSHPSVQDNDITTDGDIQDADWKNMESFISQ